MLGLALLVVAGFLVYLLSPILMPFLVGAALAYLGDPITDRLEEWGLSRTLAVVVVFVSLTLLVLGALLLLIPGLGQQVDYLREQLPLLIDWVRVSAVPWLESTLGVDVAEVGLEEIRRVVTGNWQTTGSVAATVISETTRSSLALVGWAANIALIPVVTFYLLRDWDVLMEAIRDLLPRDIQPVTVRLARECDEVLGAFIRGQLMVMISLGVIYSSGLWLVGLKLGLLIGIVAGIANVVPYLGFVVGIAAAVVATLVQFGEPLIPLVLVAVVFMAGQLLEGTVLTPLLVGDRIGLHPVAVIFAVLAGGQLFGFVGVLLALPAAAVIMVLLRHAHDRYRASGLYDRAPPEQTGTTEE
ncbi:AI-2E family transporter [Ectothiorhodospiraceae bacterium WFHF3C12]|nr:AI-2E family transporter [Ectothiorhodospiraceae bacterium WFHF3C12]